MSSIASVEGKVLSSKVFVEAVVADTRAGILVAYSGGPDSTALLYFFLNQLHGSMKLEYIVLKMTWCSWVI